MNTHFCTWLFGKWTNSNSNTNTNSNLTPAPIFHSLYVLSDTEY